MQSLERGALMSASTTSARIWVDLEKGGGLTRTAAAIVLTTQTSFNISAITACVLKPRPDKATSSIRLAVGWGCVGSSLDGTTESAKTARKQTVLLAGRKRVSLRT